MSDVPRQPLPRCAKHDIPLMWFRNFRGKPRYRCAICVADAKIKIDRECKNWRRSGRKC